MNNKKLELLRRELASLPEGTLHVKHGRKYTSFVEYKSRKEVKNINQDMDRVHLLARKKYITSLLKSADTSQLLKDYLEAGLDISRITLTPSQYKWMHTPFKSHPSRADDLKYSTLSGIRVRSLSERDIGNMYETLGIPYRYEMALTMDVSDLVDSLEQQTSSYRGRNPLFDYSRKYCHWNVPDNMNWLNLPGSIWKRFDSRTNTITIYPDFNPLSFDGKRLVHEHEGLTNNPIYRCNASERIFVMRHTGAVDEGDLFTTFERDIMDSKHLEEYLRRNILPRI